MLMSKNIYTPFTYLLKFKPTNQFYYGVKFAKNCHPDDLFKTYFSSSKVVNKLIKDFGKEAFDFEIRKTFKTAKAAIAWEKTVLSRMKVLKSNKWLNLNISAAISAETVKKVSLMKYGVENPFQAEEIKEKIKNTNLENLGVEYPTQSPEILEKQRTTNIEKYGAECVFQSEEIKEKLRNTWTENWGHDHFAKSEKWKAEQKQRNLKKYGQTANPKSVQALRVLYICEECGFTNNVGNVSRHLKQKGHSGKRKLDV